MQHKDQQSSIKDEINDTEKKAIQKKLFKAIYSGDLIDLKFLIENKKIDVNTLLVNPKTDYTSTPLALALKYKKVDIFKYLLSQGALPTFICSQTQNTLLIEAVIANSFEIVEMLLSLNKIDINYKNKQGYSAIYYACNPYEDEKINIKIIEILLKQPEIDLLQTYNGYTLYELDDDIELIKLLNSKLKIWSYAENLLETPTARLGEQYINELKNNKTDIKIEDAKPKLTEIEKTRIKGRLTWSNVVSSCDKELEKNKPLVRKQLINRLKRLGYKKANAKLIDQCIEYIKENSTVVITFNAASAFKSGLKSFRPLNVFENNDKNKDQKYFEKREITEQGLFENLDESLKEELLNKDKSTRPKYAALILGDIKNIYNYGSSFLVLNLVVMMNSLINYSDSMEVKFNQHKDCIPATYHNLEGLLNQINDQFLHAIIEAVRTGKFPSTYNQQYTGKIYQGGYIEIMIPEVNLLDNNIVDHIHISEKEYKLSEKERSLLENKLKLKVTNYVFSPFVNLESNESIKNNMKEFAQIGLVEESKSGQSVILHPNAKINGMTSVHRLISARPDSAIKYLQQLIALGADIDAKIDLPKNIYDGMTPIMYCMSLPYDYKLREIFNFLLKQGANIYITNTSNETLLTQAAKMNNGYINELLDLKIKAVGPKTAAESILVEINLAFIRAIYYNNLDILRKIRLEFDGYWKHIERIFFDKLKTLLGGKSDVIEQLKKTNLENKHEVVFGYLVELSQSKFYDNQIDEGILNKYLSLLCQMDTNISINSPLPYQWHKAYLIWSNYYNNQNSQIQIKENKRPSEGFLEDSNWGDKKSKKSITFFNAYDDEYATFDNAFGQDDEKNEPLFDMDEIAGFKNKK